MALMIFELGMRGFDARSSRPTQQPHPVASLA
jgi:hypothetical protein